MNRKPVYYYQKDKAWSAKGYETRRGNLTIGTGGCGPTCCAMTISTITGKAVEPTVTMEWGCKQGYVLRGVGVADGSFFPKLHQKYGIRCAQVNDRGRKNLKRMLDEGYFIIAAMGRGLWTTTGHFILVYGMDDKTVYINDPNSTEYAKSYGDIDLFFKQMVNAYWVDARGLKQKEEDGMTKDELVKALTPEDLATLVGKMDATTATAVVEKAQLYYAGQSVPDWGRTEYGEAIAAGITDGTRPMCLATRLEDALMAYRTMKKREE